jgi:hypothetical protein
MTNPSKNPFADPSLMTLGELKERILDMRHIDLLRRRDIASGWGAWGWLGSIGSGGVNYDSTVCAGGNGG